MENVAQPSIKKNIIYNTLYQILAVITPLITAPYLSRVLGAEMIGIQSYTTSIETYFGLFAALGTSTYGARTIAQSRNDKKQYSKLFWEIELLSVFTTGICLIGWFIFIAFSNSYTLYYKILSLNLIAVLFDISWFFTGVEQFPTIVLRNTAVKLINLAAIFAFVKDSDDLTLYMILLGATTLISNITMWLQLPKFVSRIPIKELSIFPHFKNTIVYFVPTIATTVYTVLDKSLIGIITNDAYQNGYYEQAEKVLSVIKSFVYAAVNTVVGTRISFLFSENNYNEIKKRIKDSLNYISFMGIGCMFGLVGVAKNFVPVFFGSGYDEVVLLLYIFSPTIIIIGLSNCIGTHYFTPSGNIKTSSKFIIVGSVVNLFFNLLLIPILQSNGAAIATVIAELSILILYVHNSDGYFTWKNIFTALRKKIISGLIMLIAVIFVGYVFDNFSTFFTLVIQVLVGLSVYLISLWVLKDCWTRTFIKSACEKFLNRIRKEK